MGRGHARAAGGRGARRAPCEAALGHPRSFTLLAANGRALGGIALAGGAVGFAALGLPHGRHFSYVADVTISSVAALVGLWAWRRRHLGALGTATMVTFGSICVSAGVYSGGGDYISMSAAVTYVWLALVAGLFLSPRMALAQVCFIAAAYATVLALSGNQGAPAEWLFVTGTAAVTAAVTLAIRADFLRLSERDPLTGLPNRAGLLRALERDLARCRRLDSALSLAIVDLDDFKALNDAQGHLAGDDALVRTVRSWQRALRASDVQARFGGDEFVVVLPDTAALPAARVVRRMGRLDSAWRCSAGLACWNGTETVDELLARADAALYEAKARGRSRTVVLARRRPVPADSTDERRAAS